MSGTFFVLTPKAPGERVDYTWLPPLDSGENISGTPANATRISGTATLDVQSNNNTSVTFFFTTGTDGETSQFLAEVTTNGGRIYQATLYLPVKETAITAPGAKLVEIFPAFAGVDGNVISYWVEQALLTTGTWQNDHATMLLAAHLMATNGLGSNPVTQGLTKFKSGTVDMTFSEAGANTIGYNATPYGQQFSMLLRRRFAGPRTIVAGVAGCPC